MRFYDGDLRLVGVGGTLREGSSSLGALRRALAAAEEAGAETELLDLRELGLPMYEPGRELVEYGPEVGRFVGAVKDADALILSTAAYHGTLAGVTKNALDFVHFLSGGERPYLDGKVVGLISTAGGEQAASSTSGAMVDVVHALRGVVVPLSVQIPRAWKVTDEHGDVTDDRYGDRLGRLVVELGGRLAAEPAGVAA